MANKKPLHLLAPSAFTKNAKRNEAAGVFNQAEYPALDADSVPETLQEDEIASRYWRGLVPLMNSQRVLSVGDAVSFANYCKLLADIERFEKLVAKEGITYQLKDGSYGRHPLIPEIARNRTLCNLMSQQFGLTPASRTKAAPIPVKETSTNEFEQD